VDKNLIITKTVDYIKETLSGEGSGHDWWHVYRVWELAKHIAKEEKGSDIFVVELTALLHDIADWKFNNGDDLAGPKLAREWLGNVGVDIKDIDHICENIQFSSFKGAGTETKQLSLEGQIFQDADRLDALGAIGIARTFAYGGHAGQEIYNPEKKPTFHDNAENYKKHIQSGKVTTINHFYEKLLLIKDRMNTKTGKKIAEKRHKFMKEYLDRFFKEWEGKI
jgi:uncharacterized protein